MYWIGVDGGGTKTEFLLSDEQGHILDSFRAGSTSYKHVGMSECIAVLRNGLKTLEKRNEKIRKEGAGICFALPNYGESKKSDKLLENAVAESFQEYQTFLVNDCEVGWSGSLGLNPGINLVAGTGAIVFGKDGRGNTARAGGWSDYFSDEGSCNWLGKRTMELFSKESDGRAKKGALLEIMRERFELEEDFDMIDIFEERYQHNRTSTAGLQRILLEAAKQGDGEAVSLYREAAEELAEGVLAVYRKLEWETGLEMSYSGGLFHAGEYILEPLKEKMKSYPIRMKTPMFTPAQGAVLLAAGRIGSSCAAEVLKKTWQSI